MSWALTAVRSVPAFALLFVLLSVNGLAQANGLTCTKVFQIETVLPEAAVARLMKKYKKDNCHANAFAVAEELIAAGENPREIQFLLLSTYSGMEALLPRDSRFSNQGWKFHVVLKLHDQIYDLDFKRSMGPVNIESYFKSMFHHGYEVAKDINVQVYSYQEAKAERAFFGNIHPLFQLVSSHVKSVRLREYLLSFREAEKLESLQAVPVYAYGLGNSLWSSLRMPLKMAMVPKGSRVRFEFTKKYEPEISNIEYEIADGILLASNINFVRLKLPSGQIFEVPFKLINLDTFRRLRIDEGLASNR